MIILVILQHKGMATIR